MDIKKILRYLLIGGIFAVPFIPLLISSSMFFPFITGKNFAFRILVELLLGGWAVLAVLDKAYRPRFSWLLISVLSLVGIMAFADFFGVNPFKSFWSNFERMEGLISLIHLAGYFVVTGIVLNTEKLWNRFFNTSVIVSVIIGFYGLLQLAGKIKINQGGVRLDGTFGNASYLAIYMLFHVFITLFLLVRWRGGAWMRYIYGAAIILQLVILYFTATRGAILGLVGGVLLTSILISIFEKQRRQVRKIAIGVLIAIIVLIGAFFAVKDTQSIRESAVLSRLSSISIEDGTPRFKIWSMAFQGVKERPLLGWGQENFNFVFNKYYNPELFSQEPWFDRVHNIFFDWLIAGGILGFIAYFSIPIFMLYYLWRRLEIDLSVTEKSLFTGLLAGYFFHNMFVFDNIVSYILFFSIAAYIHTHSTLNNKATDKTDENKDGGSGVLNRVAIPIIIIALISSIYFLNIKGIAAARTLIQAIGPQAGGLEVNLEKLNKALSYRVVGKQEVIEQTATAAMRVKSGGAPIEMQTKFFELANGEMGKLVEERHEDARIRIFYAAFLNNFNFFQEALPHLKKAVELSPKKQTIAFELGTAYLNLGEADKAFEIFEETYNLDTNFKNAEIIYRVGGIFAGKEAQVNERIGPISDNDRADNRIIQAYVKTGRFGEAAKSLELALLKNPNDPQKFVSLGAVYLELGRRQDAINAIQRAVDLDPNFKEQGEFFIREIEAGRNP
ncbi:MAG: O-antigen ligase family protein [Candidatus Paceibacteria bacterium]